VGGRGRGSRGGLEDGGLGLLKELGNLTLGHLNVGPSGGVDGNKHVGAGDGQAEEEAVKTEPKEGKPADEHSDKKREQNLEGQIDIFKFLNSKSKALQQDQMRCQFGGKLLDTLRITAFRHGLIGRSGLRRLEDCAPKSREPIENGRDFHEKHSRKETEAKNQEQHDAHKFNHCCACKRHDIKERESRN